MADLKRILVTGARGNVGGAVIRALAASSATAVAGGTAPENMPAPEGIEKVTIDYTRPDTVKTALEGVDGLFLVAPPLDWEAPAKIDPVIDRARAAGVRHIIFNSAMGVDQNEEAPLRVIEKRIISSGIDYTILRPNFFMENFTSGFLAPMIAQGGIFLAAGEAGTSFISIEDIAAVAAVAFQKQHFGAEYNLTGPSALNHTQVAGIISEVSGRSVKYQSLSEEAMLQGARDQGMPEDAIRYMAVLYSAVRNGWTAAVSDAVEKVTGRSPISFGEFAQKNAMAWK